MDVGTQSKYAGRAASSAREGFQRSSSSSSRDSIPRKDKMSLVGAVGAVLKSESKRAPLIETSGNVFGVQGVPSPMTPVTVYPCHPPCVCQDIVLFTPPHLLAAGLVCRTLFRTHTHKHMVRQLNSLERTNDHVNMCALTHTHTHTQYVLTV